MTRNKIVKVFAFWALFGILFIWISNMMSVNGYGDIANIRGFYKEPDHSLDVILIGPSQIYSDYSAPLAWKSKGYTSYALSLSNASSSMYELMAKEALKYQNPQVLIFEVSAFTLGKLPIREKAPVFHTWFDNQPLSIDKLKGINEIIPKKYTAEYVFPLIAYHQNWKNILECAKALTTKVSINISGVCYTKGFKTISYCNEGNGLKQSGTLEFTDEAQNDLYNLIRFCKKSKLEHVLFLSCPNQTQYTNPQILDEIGAIITGEGYDFLNLNKNYEDVGISDETDFCDQEHMNVRGTRKLTKYLSDYLSENYNLPNKHSEKLTKYWEKCMDKTDAILQEANNDLNEGIIREYFEFSVYMKPRRLN